MSRRVTLNGGRSVA